VELHTKRQLVALLKERGIRPSRGLGQNFLIDQNLLRLVKREADLQPKDVVLEIGCGTGLLTRHLCESGATVCAVEIDRRLAEICGDYLEGFENLTLLRKDVLASKHLLDPELLSLLKRTTTNGSQLKVVCNLPYAVSTPVIACLLESNLPVSLMVLTVQKEVADRLLATSNSSSYGILSVIAQVHAEVKLLRTLPPDVFWPKPKVSSAIIKLTPNRQLLDRIQDYATFRKAVQAVFSHRRKTLSNSLVAAFEQQIAAEELSVLLDKCHIDGSRRGESLTIDEIICLANHLTTRD